MEIEVELELGVKKKEPLTSKERMDIILRYPGSKAEVEELQFDEIAKMFDSFCSDYRREIFDILDDKAETFSENKVLKRILIQKVFCIGEKEKEINDRLLNTAQKPSEIAYLYVQPWCNDKKKRKLHQRISELNFKMSLVDKILGEGKY